MNPPSFLNRYVLLSVLTVFIVFIVENQTELNMLIFLRFIDPRLGYIKRVISLESVVLRHCEI